MTFAATVVPCLVAVAVTHMGGANALPNVLPSSPPGWPSAVRYSGTLNSTVTSVVNGKPNPGSGVPQGGVFSAWSVCTTPAAQQWRLDSSIPIAGTTMAINSSTVLSCPLRKKFDKLETSCLALPLAAGVVVGWPLPCTKCGDASQLTTAKAICTTWSRSDDTVRGKKAVKWSSSGCKPGVFAATKFVTTLQVDVWYDSTDGSTPLRISSRQTQAGKLGGVSENISTVITKEILEWDVSSTGANAFAHCTPNTTTVAA